MFNYKIDVSHITDMVQYVIQESVSGPKLLFELNENVEWWLKVNCSDYKIEKVSSSSGIYKLDILFKEEEDLVNFKLSWL